MPLTNERREYSPHHKILKEVQESLTNHNPGEIDWITIVGSGEPTLHSATGWLIQEIKCITDLPVAVITNGSLLHLKEVRKGLLTADSVLPSLDAGNPSLFKKINRPHPEISFDRLTDGMTAFREEYSGNLWIEVMLVRGLNDSEISLREIAAVLTNIHPDEIHINTPTRPPVETWVQPPDDQTLMRAGRILGEVSKVVQPIHGAFDLGGSGSLVDAIIGIITRHPMQEEELLRTLTSWSPETVKKTLHELENSGKAQIIERLGKRFWSSVGSHFPT
jgi:wyosine [tRNA(Phe)-imidazoG37] synthetase (radical SAM superfamily)